MSSAVDFIKPALVATVVIGLQMYSFNVSSQTYSKCIHPSGRVEFSDRGCDVNSQGTVLRQHSNTLDASASRQQNHVEPQRDDPSQSRIANQERVKTAVAPAQGVCPTDLEISNLETKASSITLRDVDRKFLQAEIRRARACKKDGGSYGAEDWKQINEAQNSVNRIDSRDSEAARVKAEGIHSVSASDGEKTRMIADKEIEARESAARAAAQASASTITSCDPGGCWDNLGRRFNKSGDVGNFLRHDGNLCQSIGGLMQCK
jgi:hypothetical protein